MTDIFYLEITDKRRRSLRRYRSSRSNSPCTASGYGYCNAHSLLPDGHGDEPCRSFSNAAEARFTFSNWPTRCACGYEFQDTDEWQEFGRFLYRRIDTGETMTTEEAPLGACWNATWMIDRRTPPCWYVGPDGRCLIIKTPGGEFMPDARANNCTLPNDNIHKCWTRHGSPENGDLTIDKTSGPTCAAGAGSIALPRWHGFIRNSCFT